MRPDSMLSPLLVRENCCSGTSHKLRQSCHPTITVQMPAGSEWLSDYEIVFIGNITFFPLSRTKATLNLVREIGFMLQVSLGYRDVI